MAELNENDNAALATLDARRKKMFYRSWHRGNKEMDLYLGQFARDRLAGMSEEQADAFEQILDLDDHSLYAWITRKEELPANLAAMPLMQEILDYNIG